MIIKGATKETENDLRRVEQTALNIFTRAAADTLKRGLRPSPALLFFVALAQGVDFLITPSSYRADQVASAVPWSALGIILILSSVVGLFAVWRQCWRLAIPPHTLCAGVYVLLAIGVLVRTVIDGRWYGWGLSAIFGLIAGAHIIHTCVSAYRAAGRITPNGEVCKTCPYRETPP